MPVRIRARYADGVLTPLDPVDLRDGVEVALAIDTALPETHAPANADAQQPPQGDPRDLAWGVARIKRQQRAMPDDAWDDFPTDLPQIKRHDRFATPREEQRDLPNEIPALARAAAKIRQFEERQQQPPPVARSPWSARNRRQGR